MKYPYKMSYINKMARKMDKVLGEESRINILKSCEALTSKNKKDYRASKMNDVMIKMEELLSEKEIVKIREGCACKPTKFKNTIKSIKNKTIDTEERIIELESSKLVGNIIKIHDKMFRIEFRSKKCYCGMVGSSETVIPLSWCHCCKEHVKWVFETTLDLSVKPDLISSVISGGDDCIFELTLE